MEPVVVVHAVAASFVLAIGPVQILRRRKDVAHRVLGRVWAVVMLITCATSFAIHPHGFSWLHGLAVFTLFCLVSAILAIRRRNVAGHRRAMVGSYIGTLVAFVFAATMPNRAIARMAVNDPVDLALAAALVLGVSALLVWTCLATVGRRRVSASGGSAVGV